MAARCSDEIRQPLGQELENSLRYEIQAIAPATRQCPEDLWEFNPGKARLVVLDESQNQQVVFRADIPHPVSDVELLGIFDDQSKRVAIVEVGYSCSFRNARRESGVRSWLFLQLSRPQKLLWILNTSPICTDSSEASGFCAWIHPKPQQSPKTLTIAVDATQMTFGRNFGREGTFLVRPSDSGLVGAIDHREHPTGFSRLLGTIPEATQKQLLPVICLSQESRLELCILRRPMSLPPELGIVAAVSKGDDVIASSFSSLPWNSPVTLNPSGFQGSHLRRALFADIDLNSLDPRESFVWPEEMLAEYDNASVQTLAETDTRAFLLITLPCFPIANGDPGLLPENEVWFIDANWSQPPELQISPYLVSTCQLFGATKGHWPTFENGSIRLVESTGDHPTVEITWRPPKILKLSGNRFVEAEEDPYFGVSFLTRWPEDLNEETISLRIDN